MEEHGHGAVPTDGLAVFLDVLVERGSKLRVHGALTAIGEDDHVERTGGSKVRFDVVRAECGPTDRGELAGELILGIRGVEESLHMKIQSIVEVEEAVSNVEDLRGWRVERSDLGRGLRPCGRPEREREPPAESPEQPEPPRDMSRGIRSEI
jgi:hypothetical protein